MAHATGAGVGGRLNGTTRWGEGRVGVDGNLPDPSQTNTFHLSRRSFIIARRDGRRGARLDSRKNHWRQRAPGIRPSLVDRWIYCHLANSRVNVDYLMFVLMDWLCTVKVKSVLNLKYNSWLMLRCWFLQLAEGICNCSRKGTYKLTGRCGVA